MSQDGLSLNNVTLSMHGAQQSAIEYNEHLDRFEEVPIDEQGVFRGSFPDSKHGYDIPDSGYNQLTDTHSTNS